MGEAINYVYEVLKFILSQIVSWVVIIAIAIYTLIKMFGLFNDDREI